MLEYAYYDAANHALDFDGLLNSLKQAQAGDVVLFHGCCHNPTGIDPTAEQWAQLAELSVANGWLPLFDFAYQASPMDWKRMRRACVFSPPNIKS